MHYEKLIPESSSVKFQRNQRCDTEHLDCLTGTPFIAVHYHHGLSLFSPQQQSATWRPGPSATSFLGVSYPRGISLYKPR